MIISSKAVIIEYGEILLVKHDGRLTLPGGKKKENETSLETLLREVREELGCEVYPTGRPLKLEMYDRRYYFYNVAIIEKEPRQREDDLRLVWLPLGLVPKYVSRGNIGYFAGYLPIVHAFNR